MKFRRLAIPLLIASCTLSTNTAQPISTAAEPNEVKRQELKDLDGHFPFTPPATLEEWEKRSEEVRQQLKISLGLWPMPKLQEVQPVVHSTRELDGYAIAKVYFESLPGFYVTGSLYLPRDGKSPETKRPGILCPHGHWDNGRFYHASDAAVKRELATGSERFEAAAKNPLQARSVQLARMGCVVFLYDMIGYADSQQISFDRAHRFGLHGENPPVEKDSWLLYSPQAELNMQSVMGLQTLNSLQAFEFMLSRPDVDASKIAITGASGGGTQSFIAAAIEPRIAAAMPAVMVGTHMQGGCTCENACYLRVNTGNVEIAATIAPRPLGLTTADDWTKDMANDGFPELQKIYSLFDAKKKVELHQGLHFPHNYNHVSRVAMYGFISRTFNLGFEEPILERDFEFQTKEQLTVWDEQNLAPENGIDFEAKLLKHLQANQLAQIQEQPDIAKQGLLGILGFSESIAKHIRFETVQSESSQSNVDKSQRVQALNAAGTVVATIEIPKGKIDSVTFASSSNANDPADHANTAITDQTCVITIHDPLGQELQDGLQPVVKNPRPAPAYTFGYNPPWMLRRTGVALAIIDQLSANHGLQPGALFHAEGSDAVLLQLLKSSRSDLVKRIEAKEAISADNVNSYRDPAFVPGLALYGSALNN